MKKSYIISVSFTFAIIYFIIGAMQCAGTEQQEEKSQTHPPPIPENLAPGTAKVEAKLIRVEKMAEKTICTVKVLNVLGYGMATRPVATDSELSFELVDASDDRSEELTTSSTEDKWIFIIRFSEQMSKITGSIVWRANYIKKKIE